MIAGSGYSVAVRIKYLLSLRLLIPAFALMFFLEENIE
jgi:hypothetical protein